MFKVPSLVFDIELEDNGIGGGWCQEEEWEEDEIVNEIQRFVQPTTAAEARLVADVRVALSHCNTATAAAAAEAGPRLVSILTALGYAASLRTALGGGDGADCLRNLRHSFIAVELPTSAPAPAPPAAAAAAAAQGGGIAGAAGGSGMGGIAGAAGGATGGGGMVTGGLMGGYSHSAPCRRYVVDPVFKEQFIIAKTTSRYASILGAVPQCYVGPEEHLGLLVQFLCAEMATAFRQLGSVLPPWRQAGSMLSKWAPRKSIDVADPKAAAAAAAAEAAADKGGLMTTPTTTMMGGAAAMDGHCLQLGGGGFHQQQQQQQQMPWPCRPAAARQPLHLHQQHQHRQQQQQQQQHGLPPPGPVAPMPPPSYEVPGAGNRRQSFEPQRVVFGGNFVPVGPQPVS
ncbi:hypothetical protein HYH02_002605 [Chlamydomonas schloesseri]|uniref:Uncharacterized protein n=1 Tax=Chlamydomonas schloesseri TaxID=2026947 RepID=A0A835WSR6_9CHLO|nr:hypothetical protein HYH02_002605 [Chlamydomonas schloesseri]|eukprot:KAG2453282.1 hypothetical protein HYH02_002605 [Chlamydomonas schloesseri]